jgi:hypothetical protein
MAEAALITTRAGLITSSRASSVRTACTLRAITPADHLGPGSDVSRAEVTETPA